MREMHNERTSQQMNAETWASDVCDFLSRSLRVSEVVELLWTSWIWRREEQRIYSPNYLSADRSQFVLIVHWCFHIRDIFPSTKWWEKSHLWTVRVSACILVDWFRWFFMRIQILPFKWITIKIKTRIKRENFKFNEIYQFFSRSGHYYFQCLRRLSSFKIVRDSFSSIDSLSFIYFSSDHKIIGWKMKRRESTPQQIQFTFTFFSFFDIFFFPLCDTDAVRCVLRCDHTIFVVCLVSFRSQLNHFRTIHSISFNKFDQFGFGFIVGNRLNQCECKRRNWNEKSLKFDEINLKVCQRRTKIHS